MTPNCTVLFDNTFIQFKDRLPIRSWGDEMCFQEICVWRGFRGRETLKTVSLFIRQRRHGRVIPSSEAAELTRFSGRYSHNVLLETKVGFSQKFYSNSPILKAFSWFETSKAVVNG